jgi:DNA-binding NarL/FixJ family response regulator
MSDKIKIILVDDHAVVRAGFSMLLAADEHIEVVAEAERGEQAIQLYQELQPDMIVMDARHWRLGNDSPDYPTRPASANFGV